MNNMYNYNQSQMPSTKPVYEDPFVEKMLKKYLNGWRQTRNSFRSVSMYKKLGFLCISDYQVPQIRHGTAFILGSGPTINHIDQSMWDVISKNFSVAFNNFITHPFVPNMYVVQSTNVGEIQREFDLSYKLRSDAYKNTIFLARSKGVNNFTFHKTFPYDALLQERKSSLYFTPEIFVSSDAKINPLRLLRHLVQKNYIAPFQSIDFLPKFGATVPMLHILCSLLGYKKIVLCGIDMYDTTHFYDRAYGFDYPARFEIEDGAATHPHVNTKEREFSVKRIIIDQARELANTWGVETFCLSAQSELYPHIPLYSGAADNIILSRRNKKEKLRIAMVTGSFLPKKGGMELQLHNLASRLAKCGHDITVFAPDYDAYAQNSDEDYQLVHFDKKWSHRFFKNSPRRLPLPKGVCGLAHLFQAHHKSKPFDVISAHSAFKIANYALDLRDLYEVPVITRCHGADINKSDYLQYGWRLDPEQEKIINDALRRSDRCVAISADVASEMQEIPHCSEIVVIPNGIDVAYFTKESVCRKNLFGIADENIVCLMVGRNVKTKNMELGIKSFRKLYEKFPNLYLFVVGANSRQLRKLAQQLHVDERTRFFDAVSQNDLKTFYSASDIFLMTSLLETFGSVTAEAMSCCLPVVALEAPGTTAQVRDGATGILVHSNSDTDFAAALSELVADPSLRRNMGAKGRECVEKYFSWESVVEQYERLYAEVAAQPYYVNKTLRQMTSAKIEAIDRGYPIGISGIPLMTNYYCESLRVWGGDFLSRVSGGRVLRKPLLRRVKNYKI